MRTIPTHTPTEDKVFEAVSICLADGNVTAILEQHHGGQCCVYRAKLQDGRSCAVRVPLYMTGAGAEALLCIVKDEIDTLVRLNNAGFGLCAQYLGSDLTFDNAMGYPFIVTSWLDGETLVWSDSTPQEPARGKILVQLACLLVELIECTLEERKDNQETATQFFDRVLQNRRDKVSAGAFPELTTTDCDVQRWFVHRSINKDFDRLFAMNHGDFGPNNIIMNPEDNVVGIIDPGFAQMDPLQVAGSFPLLLQLRSPTDHVSALLRKDRMKFVEAVKSLEKKHPRVVPLVHKILSTEDVDDQYFILSSTRSKGLHAELAKAQWNLPNSRSDASLASYAIGKVEG